MALKQEKYDIWVQNDDAIKHTRIFFDFIQRKFNSLDGLYLHGKIPLIYTITENQPRNQSEAEVERLKRKKRTEKKKRKLHPSLLQKKAVL